MAANYIFPNIAVDYDWFQAEIADQLERSLKMKWGKDFIFEAITWDDTGHFEGDILDSSSPRSGSVATIDGSLQIDSKGRAFISKIGISQY